MISNVELIDLKGFLLYEFELQARLISNKWLTLTAKLP